MWLSLSVDMLDIDNILKVVHCSSGYRYYALYFQIMGALT